MFAFKLSTHGIMAIGLALFFGTGCAGHGVPAHGGGMRFYWEQEVLSKATELCLKDSGIGALAGKKVRLVMHVVGHEGGGATGATPGILEFAAASTVVGPAAAAAGGVFTAATQTESADDYQPFAYAQTRDIEFLRGALIFALAESGTSLCDSKDTCEGTLHVLVSNFGTDKWSHGFMVLRKERLTARVAMRMMFVENDGRVKNLGGRFGVATYGEAFFCGVQWDEPEVREGPK